MTRCFAWLLLAACAAPSVARAQAHPAETAEAVRRTAGTAPAGGPVAQAVAEQAAARLGLERTDVVVVWTSDEVPAARSVRLLGSGASGAYVVELDTGSRVMRRRVRIGVREAVKVAARDLDRGDRVTAADMVVRDTVLWGRTVKTAPEPGWVARRRIPAGTVLAAPAVAPPAVVEAGREVTLVWRSRDVEITTRAVAAGTAAAGERVAVRTESGRRLWGIAEASGRVRIEGRDR